MVATLQAVLSAMSEVKAGRPIECELFGQVECNRDCSVLNGCPLSVAIRRTETPPKWWTPLLSSAGSGKVSTNSGEPHTELRPMGGHGSCASALDFAIMDGVPKTATS